ncbi:acetylxylan esterase, partial [Candidatus Sumerlaeota bacterium]|nr:acetylxylan esterase [Candidatus Sumerlaeota bacterium]
GRAGLSVFYLELKRGLDILCSHKHADRDRIAVTGLSGGGWQTIVISSLDTRVKLAAPNAGYCALGPRIEYRADTGDLEQNPTDLVSVADYVHLTALLAPRPALLIYNAKDDCCFPADRALASVYWPVVPVYKLFERGESPAASDVERFANHVNHDPGTHNYLKDNREAFYRFINRHFMPAEKRIDEDLPVENEIRSSAALAISYPPDNANFHTLAADLMRSLPTSKPPASDGKAMDRWREGTRKALREVVRSESDLAVDPKPVNVAGFSDVVKGVAGRASALRLGDRWTLPVVVYERKGARTDRTVLTITDRGMADARDIVAEALGRGERAVVLDILFTGDCVPPRGAGHWAQMIGTVGRRPLGIQVSQLRAVAEWIERGQTGKPLRVVTKGRVAGLAALVCAALYPQSFDSLELREMDKSLKDLAASKVTYISSPSLFCFGLLAVADIPELLHLAHPTKVNMQHTER